MIIFIFIFNLIGWGLSGVVGVPAPGPVASPLVYSREESQMSEDQVQPESRELSERLCQIVNEILTMFNQNNISPPEAGTVVLALIHRLMGVLQESPEAQRAFVASVIEVVNEHLLSLLESSGSPPCQS
jgi:hypothetical protein